MGKSDRFPQCSLRDEGNREGRTWEQSALEPGGLRAIYEKRLFLANSREGGCFVQSLSSLRGVLAPRGGETGW